MLKNQEKPILGETVVNGSSSTEDISIQSTGDLSIKNFLTGTANFPDLNTVTSGSGIRTCGFKGDNSENWQSFIFYVEADFAVNASKVSLSLQGISNYKGANNMNYAFRNIRSSHNGSTITVTGEVLVGDTDGYLFQIGYLCIVA